MKPTVLAALCLLAMQGKTQQIKYRQYTPGGTLRYRLTSESSYNGKLSGKSVSVARLNVVKDSGAYAEEIAWQSKTAYRGKDTLLLDSMARTVKPYKISLLPGASVPLPKLNNAEMVGDITDLNTFFVAISPKMNIHKLGDAMNTTTNEQVVEGHFADGAVILNGGDCIQVTQTLLRHTKKYAMVRTDFLPPQSFCLTPLADTIRSQIFAFPNNFQMLQRAGANTNLLWGIESFSIITRIDNKDGKILEATMTNTLDLRMRINVSPDLNTFLTEMPYKISRSLKLELLQ